MSHTLPSVLILCLAAALACAPHAAPGAAEAPGEVKPLDTWSGKPADAALKAAAPESGVVTDADAWKKIWSAWRPDEERPHVDFDKDLILIATADGPNRVNLTATRDQQGDVTVVGAATRMAGPGFGYALARVPRDGIKSVNGNPVASGGAAPGKPRGAKPAGKPLAEYAASFADGKLTVTARGTNNTGGWTNALEPVEKRDGPAEFKFTQTRPRGIATQAFKDFTATATADAATKPEHVIVTDTAGRHSVPVK
jgi:hypothetical protein